MKKIVGLTTGGGKTMVEEKIETDQPEKGAAAAGRRSCSN